MALDWKGAPGNIIAQGQRGMYSIQTLTDNRFVLQAIDGEARKDLGFFGTQCFSLDAAKEAAEQIDGAI